jgi:hypothetical protein
MCALPLLQVSLSDDELEYSSAGRTSGSGGGGKGAPRTSMDGKAAQVGRLLSVSAALLPHSDPPQTDPDLLMMSENMCEPASLVALRSGSLCAWKQPLVVVAGRC